MNRFLIVPLVFALSGVPAAAFVCDLVLCPDPAKPAAPSAGCHDHGLPESGQQLTTRADDCTHLSPVDLYVASGSRIVMQPVAPAPVTALSQVSATFVFGVDVGAAHGPPQPAHATSPVPLRI